MGRPRPGVGGGAGTGQGPPGSGGRGQVEPQTTTGPAGDVPAFTDVMARLRVPRRRGRPRSRPDVVLADKAYSSRAIRDHLRKRGIRTVIPIPAAYVPGPAVSYAPACRRRRHPCQTTCHGHREPLRPGTVPSPPGGVMSDSRVGQRLARCEFAEPVMRLPSGAAQVLLAADGVVTCCAVRWHARVPTCSA
ncbi:transposase [Streptomyces auratus]|uniref:transposase n=1 Tax=Streptomyces TaxID=1883 RepID=UPI003D1F9677